MKETAKQLSKQHADNGAVVVGAIIQILVMFGVVDKFELTPDQVAQLGGLLLILGGGARSFWQAHVAAKSHTPPPAASE